MPELPEVETVRQVLIKWCLNKVIVNCHLFYDKLLVNTNIEEFKKLIVGQKIVSIDRRGKFIVFCLDNRVCFTSHLRMEGKWHYGHMSTSQFANGIFFDLAAKLKNEAHKHAHFLLELDNGNILIYEDTRKFGRINLLTEHDSPLKKLGYEPFDERLTSEYLANKFQKYRGNIKQALLDQSIIAGFGNIYVDELLFAIGILPSMEAKNIPSDKLEELIKNGRIILNKAIDLGGSTVSSYHSANNVDGKFQNELQIYGRKGEKCFKCGASIFKMELGGRGTVICPRCQKGFIKNRVIGVSGAIGSGKSEVCKLISDFNYKILDADEITRNSQAINGELYSKIIKLFEKFDIIEDDGNLNRGFIRKIILEDPNYRNKLESIVHPFVARTMLEEIIINPNDNYVLDVPLLYESKINEICDVIIIVNCDQKVRYERLKQRAMPLQEAKKFEAIVKRYQDRSQYIVDNSFDKNELKQQIIKFMAGINQRLAD